MDRLTILFFGSVIGLLALGSLCASFLLRKQAGATARSVGSTLRARVMAWWAMCVVMAVAMLSGGIGSVIVFGLSSFLLLREFITITPTRKADHGALFWAFFVILPLQYYALYTEWYGLFIILIPVYAFLIIPIRMVAAGDASRFLERTAKIQWGLMLCIYCVSHAPALLKLSLPGGVPEGFCLLLFLCLIVQIHDLTHALLEKILPGHKLAPTLGARESWEAVAIAVLLSVGTGSAFAWATPFSPAQAAGMALGISIMALSGRLCWTAIQNDRGRQGVVVVHTRPPMIERLIPLCFAAPLFLHLTRYFFAAGPLAGF